MSRRHVHDLLELVTATNHVAAQAEQAVVNAVHTARNAGASWKQIADMVDSDVPTVKARFKHADPSVYIDERTFLALADVANERGITIEEAVHVVLAAAMDEVDAVNEGGAPVAAQTTGVETA